MPSVAAQSAPPPTLNPMARSTRESPLVSPPRIVKTQAPDLSTHLAPPLSFPYSGPPPGARPPMIRRPSRQDPLDSAAEDDGSHVDLGPRHTLRRVHEEPAAMGTDHRESNESSTTVSLPGIKDLLNQADVKPSLGSFTTPFFSSQPSPSVAGSGLSPLDSPTSRSRFSSLTSSMADAPGWWMPDERSNLTPGYPSSRSGSFSKRGPMDEEPDFKRRRSDMLPTLPDADEVARLKWQSQSRNASYPASGSISSASGYGLRMLYPPSAMSRGSISGTPLASPLSPPLESPFDTHSSRNSPMTGPLTHKFAGLTASEHSPSSEIHPPSRGRSPADRRPSLYRSNESFTHTNPFRDLSSPGGHQTQQSGNGAGGEPPHLSRVSRTRPSSPERPTKGDRRKSLAELIMESSGDNVAMAKGGHLFTSSGPGPSSATRLAPPWTVRRESSESIHSVTSLGMPPPSSDSELGGPPTVMRDRRNAGGVLPPPPPPLQQDRRRSFAGMDEDEIMDPKSDPGMRGMDVLASESARRLADERKDDDREPSPTKTSGPSTGPKYSCQYCAKTFSRPSSLRIHTYSHTGERPFVCKEASCRRRFSVQSNLKRHAKVHQQQAQAAQMNQRAPQHAMGGGGGPGGPGPHGPPQPGYYGSRPHPGPPPHPLHMGMPQHHHPPPPGYHGGPPPPGSFMARPGYDAHGPPPSHYQQQQKQQQQPPHHGRSGPPPDHGGPYHVHQRQHSHDLDPARRDVRHGREPEDWDEEEEEEDELDEDD